MISARVSLYLYLPSHANFRRFWQESCLAVARLARQNSSTRPIVALFKSETTTAPTWPLCGSPLTAPQSEHRLSTLLSCSIRSPTLLIWLATTLPRSHHLSTINSDTQTHITEITQLPNHFPHHSRARAHPLNDVVTTRQHSSKLSHYDGSVSLENQFAHMLHAVRPVPECPPSRMAGQPDLKDRQLEHETLTKTATTTTITTTVAARATCSNQWHRQSISRPPKCKTIQ